MYIKLLVIFLYVISFENTLVDSKRSFTVVLDTTASMRDEAYIIRNSMASVLDVLTGNPSTEFEDYILVPFDHADVMPVIISTTAQGLVDSLQKQNIAGGTICPELVLSGIKKALEMSKPGSSVIVFTDAYARDDYKFNEIKTLCQQTNSKVTIFLSGYCPQSRNSFNVGNFLVYYDVARACKGSLFRMEGSKSMRQSFRYIREMLKYNWNEEHTHDVFSGHNKFVFSVDDFTKDVTLTVTGENLTVVITDETGGNARVDKLIDTRHSQALHLVDNVQGDYNVEISNQGETSVTLYKRRDFPYQYGFSTRIPNTLEETSSLPIPGSINYVLIKAPARRLVPITVELRFTKEQKKLTAEVLNESEGLYITKSFFAADDTFQMMIFSKDVENHREFEAITQNLQTQQPVAVSTWTKPVIKVIGPTYKVIEYGENAQVLCKINALPSPTVQWTNTDGETLVSKDVLLEIPSVFLSYVSLANVTVNTTLNCNATNSMGTELTSIQLFVHRPYSFEVVQYPEATSIEYETEGKLYCEVNAYPEVEYKWYHNGSVLENSDNFEVIEDGHALVIKKASLDDAGAYICEVKNEVESRELEAAVEISGLEAPELDVMNTEVITKPGDNLEIKCTLSKGNPKSNIFWSYKSKNDEDFIDPPAEAIADGETLTIDSIDKLHAGVYACKTENIVGQDSKEIDVKIKYAPIISDTETETITVKEEDPVELKCEVDAEPTASVRWEMSQDDLLIKLDDRHVMSEGNTLRFNSSNRDSGNYHCIAENELGKSEKTVVVNVLVNPYIEEPASDAVRVNSGSYLTLPCTVKFGNPVPEIRWVYSTPGYKATVLINNTSSAPLRLKVSKANEGLYTCIATNKVGIDSIEVRVIAQ